MSNLHNVTITREPTVPFAIVEARPTNGYRAESPAVELLEQDERFRDPIVMSFPSYRMKNHSRMMIGIGTPMSQRMIERICIAFQ